MTTINLDAIAQKVLDEVNENINRTAEENKRLHGMAQGIKLLHERLSQANQQAVAAATEGMKNVTGTGKNSTATDSKSTSKTKKSSKK